MSIWAERQSINIDGEEFFNIAARMWRRKNLEHGLTVDLQLLMSHRPSLRSICLATRDSFTWISWSKNGINTEAHIRRLIKSRQDRVNTSLVEEYTVDLAPNGCCSITQLCFGSVGESSRSAPRIGLNTPVYQEKLTGSQYLVGLERSRSIVRSVTEGMRAKIAARA